MPRFPAYAETVSTLSSRIFSKLAARAEAMEGPIASLHVGDTYLLPLEAARAERQRVGDHARLHNYSSVHGRGELLEAVAEHLRRRSGLTIPLSQIQIVSGATSGLAVALDTLLMPGEELLLPSPFWPLIRGTTARRGGVAVQVPFYTRLGEPGFDPEAALEAAVTERTAAIYINSPHNPTGTVLGEAALDAVAKVAARHDLWILTDEVYEEVYFSEAAPPPFWAREDARGRTIAVHSLSKAYGLAGARVGFMHGPEEAMHMIRSVQTFSTYCAAGPMQVASAAALREGAGWLEEARARYKAAAAKTCEALGAPMPAGGTFLFLDVSAHLLEGEDTLGFLGRCLDQRVLLTPGGSFGDDFPGWIRLCFTSVPPDELEAALERIAHLFGR